MRTTIRMDDELLVEAKALAARTGRTLTQVIEDALRESLARGGAGGARRPFRMVTFEGKGTRRGTLPGVDLDDSAALLDLMEGGISHGIRWGHENDAAT